MPKKAKNFIIPLGTYPFDVMVSVGETDQEFKKSIEKRIHSSDLDFIRDDHVWNFQRKTRARTVHLTEGGQTIIRLLKNPTTPIEKGELAHEIFHAISMIFSTIGIKLSWDSEEAWAYAIGHLTTEIYKKL